MPLIGVIDPSHYERRHDAPGRRPQWLTLEEVEIYAEERGPKWSPWTPTLISATLGEYQERGDRVSTSALVAPCPRAEVIKRKADYIGSLDDMYKPIKGTLVHKMMEFYADEETMMAEWRFYTVVDGVEISCSPDLLTPTTLYDYKVTDNPPLYDYPYVHHKEQVEFNAFIARNATAWEPPTRRMTMPFDPREQRATNLVLVYLGPKGPKVLAVERKEEFLTPAGQTVSAKRPYVWDDEKVLEELRPRLHAFVEGLEVYPEFPKGAEEVWGGDPTWECPGPPLCNIPGCLARRWPDRLVWENDRG